MERMIIYGLVIVNIALGFVLLYVKPSPYEKRSYDKIKDE